MATILIAGATGLIGKELQKTLGEYNTIRVLTRNKKLCSHTNIFYWNPTTMEISADAFASVDCIINLSGENIGNKRWTAKQKKRIQDSRIASTRTLVWGIETYGTSVTTCIWGSAVGFYGNHTTNSCFTEEHPPGADFMARTCELWEAEAKRISNKNIRNIIIRTGVVLTNKGGMFTKITSTLPFRALPLFGSGTNNIPWIHIDDLCSIITYVLHQHHIQGTFNAVANNNSQLEFIKTIQHAYSKYTVIIPIPAVIVQILLGEMATIVLTGNTISNSKLIDSGFTFSHNNLLTTLTQELNNGTHSKS